MTGIVIGTRGWPWRAVVTDAGTVAPTDGSPPLEWWIAADDRWHEPAREASRRQQRVLGAPVVETSVAVPGGDVVHRAYAAVAGAGAAAVVELENRSRLPVAVAFSRHDVDSGRPRAVPPPGAPPAAATVVPVAHGATVRVVAGGGAAPSSVPAAEVVARGWVAQTQAAARYDVPARTLVEAVVAARSDALLDAVDPLDDVGRLLAVAERVALGDDAEPWVDDVVERAVAVAKGVRGGEAAWDAAARSTPPSSSWSAPGSGAAPPMWLRSATGWCRSVPIPRMRRPASAWWPGCSAGWCAPMGAASICSPASRMRGPARGSRFTVPTQEGPSWAWRSGGTASARR